MTSSRERIAVLLLLILFWLMAITASIHKSNTYDETPHMIGGYSYLHTGDYRIHPENGVLPQKFAALPLLFSDVHFPSTQQETWWHADLWKFGFQFLFLSGNDADRILFSGRSMIAVLGMVLGLVVFLWSRQLFGIRGAFLSLGLFVFCPTMLAHSSLITSDVSSALFFTLSLWSFWNLLHQPELELGHATRAPLKAGLWWLLTAISLAGLILSKAIWFLLVPIIPLLLVIRLLARKAPRFDWRKGAIVAAGIAISIYLLIWSFYSFRYTAFRDFQGGRDGFLFTWERVESNRAAPLIQFAREHHLLPEAFLYGNAQTISVLNRHNRVTFLNGKYSVIGWWYFFPYAFLVKTPLPLFLILLLTALHWRKNGTSVYQTTPIWVLFIVYWLFAMRSELDIGHRYLLPLYPSLYVLAGGAATVFSGRNQIQKILLALGIVWFAIESFSIRPDYLAYFNQLSGGPNTAYQHLVDSSLDWGQDLPGLQQWLEKNHKDSSPVYLSYFGTSSPEYYGISAIRLNNADVTSGTIPELHAGTYCVSATNLQCIYHLPAGHWAKAYEYNYQTLSASVASPPSDQKSEEWKRTLDQFQRLRFARLAAYLRHRAADAEIGHSILIYRLSEADIHQAIYGAPAELDSTIEVRGTKDGYIPPFL